jgi:hypothetical protein
MQHLKVTSTTMGMQAKVHELIMQVWGLFSGLDLFFWFFDRYQTTRAI